MSRGETGSTHFPIFAFASASAAAIWNGSDLLRHWDEIAASGATAEEAALALRVGATGLQLALLLFAGLARRAGPTSWRRVRACAVHAPAAAVLSATVVRSAFTEGPEDLLPRIAFFTVLLVVSGALAILPDRASGRPASRLELVAVNALVTIAVLEICLAVWARVAPSPLLFAPSLEARLAAVRPAPFSPWFGGRLNAGGYHDEPFFTADEDDLVVAVIADSFGIGVVPYADNFVTLAEKQLRAAVGHRYDRVSIHNFGVPAIGLEEYAHLLETEVARTNPTWVVLCVFVGNDIVSRTGFGAPGPARFALQEWLVGELPRRLLARHRAPEYVYALEQPSENTDPAAAPPAFSQEIYLELETRRLDVTHASKRRVARSYERFFTGLEWFQAQLGDRFMLLVFPDEFQIDDTLWQQALAQRTEPEAHVRDLPQRRIEAWAARRGVPLVDTTAALHAANGEGPVYAPRNSHLNRDGNRAAAGELGSALIGALTTAH